MTDRIEADYLIETAWPLAEAAEAMAGEQSSGTFLPVPGETPELKERAAARVVHLEDLGPVSTPSLPGAGRADAPHRQARVTLSMDRRYSFPKDSSLKILTSGLLGEQYIGIEAGADSANLAAGDTISATQSAVVLENLISQFLYSKAAEGPATEQAKP